MGFLLVHQSLELVGVLAFLLLGTTLLYTAGMVVQAHKLTLVVAASAPDSKRALFLALQVSPRDGEK